MSIFGSSFNWSKAWIVCACCAGFAAVTCLGAAPGLASTPDGASAGLTPTPQITPAAPGLAAENPVPAGGAEGVPSQRARKDSGDSWEDSIALPEILDRLQKVLPAAWEVSAVQHRQTPRRWSGAADGILIRLENPSIVAYHPNGFEYHPFFKIWLCPTLWRGSMEDVRFLEENDWSVLLGQNHKMKVFYLSQGVNDWRDGPALLRETLDLTSLSITRSLRQKIEPEIMMKVFPKLAVTGSGQSGLLERVVGLEMEGPLAYVEYATATAANGETNQQVSLSRCAEPGVVWLMERENLSLAHLIMLAYPDVQTVYLRRVCDEFASDRIINRSDVTSKEPVALSNSSY